MSNRNPEPWTLDLEPWTLDLEPWTLDLGRGWIPALLLHVRLRGCSWFQGCIQILNHLDIYLLGIFDNCHLSPDGISVAKLLGFVKYLLSSSEEIEHSSRGGDTRCKFQENIPICFLFCYDWRCSLARFSHLENCQLICPDAAGKHRKKTFMPSDRLVLDI